MKSKFFFFLFISNISLVVAQIEARGAQVFPLLKIPFFFIMIHVYSLAHIKRCS